MSDFTPDLAASHRLDRDLAALRAHQQFICCALAHRDQSKEPPGTAAQAEPPRADDELSVIAEKAW